MALRMRNKRMIVWGDRNNYAKSFCDIRSERRVYPGITSTKLSRDVYEQLRNKIIIAFCGHRHTATFSWDWDKEEAWAKVSQGVGLSSKLWDYLRFVLLHYWLCLASFLTRGMKDQKWSSGVIQAFQASISSGIKCPFRTFLTYCLLFTALFLITFFSKKQMEQLGLSVLLYWSFSVVHLFKDCWYIWMQLIVFISLALPLPHLPCVSRPLPPPLAYPWQ